MARRRASPRWWDLLNSRVANLMRPVLGEALWKLFVLHATNQYKQRFLAAFDHDVLACVGRRDGTPCPKGFAVCLRSVSAYDLLEELHLDHEQDVLVTCDMWRRALPAAPDDGDDGVKGGLLCHLFFGVSDSRAASASAAARRAGGSRATTRVLPRAPPATLHQCAQRGPLAAKAEMLRIRIVAPPRDETLEEASPGREPRRATGTSIHEGPVPRLCCDVWCGEVGVRAGIVAWCGVCVVRRSDEPRARAMLMPHGTSAVRFGLWSSYLHS